MKLEFDVLNAIIDDIVDEEPDNVIINRIFTGDEAVSYTYKISVNRDYVFTVNMIIDGNDIGVCSAFIHSAPTILNIDNLCFVYQAERKNGFQNLVSMMTGETIYSIKD